MIPALPATYAARLAVALSPAIDAMFTIAPPPDASIAGIWNFMPRKVPRTLVAMPRSNSAGSMSASGAGNGPAVALLNAASSRPNAVTAASTSSRAESTSATSDRTASARPPLASMRLTTDSSAAMSRAPRTTAAPAAANASAVAAPMPRLAPATRATRPCERQISHGRLLPSCLPYALL